MLRYKPNPSQVRSLNRQELLRTEENNLKDVRELNKTAQIRKRFQSLQLNTTDHELLQPARKKQKFTVASRTHEMNIVNTLQKPINESQTIPIKLKSKLSQKYHYQFHNVTPRKVLETAKHLVKTSELFV